MKKKTINESTAANGFRLYVEENMEISTEIPRYKITVRSSQTDFSPSGYTNRKLCLPLIAVNLCNELREHIETTWG